ncbi:MAG: glycosyltransferase family 2 protein [Candidatus Marinimicrobia bacterium]|nr:glycosyltransferase family 2 protein [Candidatus Neomarinimicrobiota bacterium]
MQVSIVICTHNRKKYLKNAIESVIHQTINKDAYEIIIVDNASSDGTDHLIRSYFSNKFNVMYFYESKVGLSAARNRGLKEAKGKYVAFLDDDAIAAPDWLEKIVENFETVKPMPGCIGGKVEPIWESERPKWLSCKMLSTLTILDLSEEPLFLTDKKKCIVGTNMAFPKYILDRLGGFKVNLGRKGNKLLSNEENLLRQNLVDKGYSIFYNPEIIVKHHIPAERLTKKWFYKRMFWQGISNVIMEKGKDSLFRNKVSILLKAILIILCSPILLLAFFLIPSNFSILFAIKCHIIIPLGYIYGLLFFKQLIIS